MRKLLLLLLTITVCLQVQAQRYANLAINLKSPVNGYVAYWNVPFKIEATIKNIGEDTVRMDDTLAFGLIFNSDTIYFGTPPAIAPYVELTGQSLDPGDSTGMGFNFSVSSNWDTGNTELCVFIYSLNKVDSLKDTVADNNTSCNTFIIRSGVSVNTVTTAISSAKVYPNPAGNIVNFDIGLSEPADAEIRITDVTGKTVLQHSGRMSSNMKTITLNTSSLTPGMYFYSVSSGGDKVNGKLEIR